MKKIVLICLVLFMMPNVCWGESNNDFVPDNVKELSKNKNIIVTADNSYGISYVYTRYEAKSDLLDPAGYWRIRMDFTLEKNTNPKNLLPYLEVEYTSDDIYLLDKMAIADFGNAQIQLPVRTNSIYANRSVNVEYGLPREFFSALKISNCDLTIRLYYKDLTGSYYQDIKIPPNKISDIQLLFSLAYHDLYKK